MQRVPSASSKPGLYIRRLRSSADRARRLAHFNGHDETWLVSDLRSKLEIQRKLLERNDFARSESVLRAREFWIMLLRRQRPKLQVVSKELLLSTIAELLLEIAETRTSSPPESRTVASTLGGEFDVTTLQTPGAARTVYSYIQQLLPVLTLDHEFGLRAWLSGDSDEEAARDQIRQSARARWGQWFELAERVWKRLLQLRLVAPEWAAAVLSADRFETLRVLDEDSSEPLWPRQSLQEVWQKPLIVDLGFAMSQIEVDLLLSWAQTTRVEILVPLVDEVAIAGHERKEADKGLGETELRSERSSKFSMPTELQAWAGLFDNANANGIVPEILNFDEDEPVDEAVVSEPWNGSFRRFPSASAEVKAAVAKLRCWLEEGVVPSRIAIVPTDVEEYWPCLREHLANEGVPVAKAWMAPAHSRPDVARWLARLRTWAAAPDRYDLQVDFFAQSSTSPNSNTPSETSLPIQYARFRELFRRVYGVDDLGLDQAVQSHYAQLAEHDGPPKPRWSRDEFLYRALHRVPEGVDLVVASRLAKSLLEECPPQLELAPASWTSYLANMAALVELPIEPAQQGGVQVLSLSALEGAGCTHVMVLGLHDASLRQPAGTALLESDVRGIEAAMGWVLDAEDRRRAEREAQWVLTQAYADLEIYFAETNFDGAALTPSWLWLVGAQNCRRAGGRGGELELPEATRFDEIQEARRAVALSATKLSDVEDEGEVASPSGTEAIANLRICRLREARDENFVHEAFAAGQIEGLTASRLSALSTCARRFAFDHIFGPDDRGELDFDPDPRRRGNLLHKTFELAGLRGFPELTREEVESLLDEARDELEGRGRPESAKSGALQIVRDEAHWPGLRARLARSVLRMLHNERERQAQEPRLRPLGFETKFRGVIQDVAFKGVIDRIDADVSEIKKMSLAGIEDLKLRAVVIDYKSSTPAASFKNWARDKHWQLLVYVLALEDGLIELENLRLREVDPTTSEVKVQRLPPAIKFRAVGAYYHDGKTMKRSGGLRLEDEAGDLFDFTQNSRTKHKREELDQALSELRAEILRVAELLRDGKFFPLREADPACDHCGWRTACRAPHLKA